MLWAQTYLFSWRTGNLVDLLAPVCVIVFPGPGGKMEFEFPKMLSTGHSHYFAVPRRSMQQRLALPLPHTDTDYLTAPARF
jgi:hypothetical protein